VSGFSATKKTKFTVNSIQRLNAFKRAVKISENGVVDVIRRPAQLVMPFTARNRVERYTRLMLVLLALNFVGGVAAGSRFRFGIVFAFGAVAVLEGLVGGYWFDAGRWYAIALLALAACEAGYVAAAFVAPGFRPMAVTSPPPDLPSEIAR
jgi:hypothetical protein